MEENAMGVNDFLKFLYTKPKIQRTGKWDALAEQSQLRTTKLCPCKKSHLGFASISDITPICV